MNFKNLIVALALVTASATASANLVTNGDFSAGKTGWTLTGNTSFSSFEGNWFSGAMGSNAYLSQTIATIAGETYEISFDTQINWGSMAASLDGLIFITATQSGHYELDVVADNDNAVLTFITRNDPSFNALDNVVVIGDSTVPEPASLALLGLGLAGLGFSRRKKA